MDNVKLKKGYKRKEVGVIPEDWDVSQVSEIGNVRGGKRLPKGQSLSNTPTSHPYIRVADMHWGGVDLSDIKYVPENVAPSIKNYRINYVDIFISVAGTLGLVGIIPKEIDGANLTENADKITNLACEKKFLLYSLMSERIQNEIKSQSTVGAQPKLAISRIENLKLAIPTSRKEQRAIATALSDVDALIAALDRLIAKKRTIKTATMQQLLTDKKRLPGFTGEWDTKPLGSIGSFKKGRNLPKKDIQQNGVPCVLYGEIYTKYNFVASICYSFVPEHIAAQSTWISKGDVLFAGSGETFEDIGKCFAYLGEERACAGGDVIIFTPYEADGQFLGYLLNSPEMNKQKSSLGQGSSVIHIYRSSLETLTLQMPSLPEQHAIAAVLSDMDAEITALEARRNKTQAIKQGMMQELLTGRTRLI